MHKLILSLGCMDFIIKSEGTDRIVEVSFEIQTFKQVTIASDRDVHHIQVPDSHAAATSDVRILRLRLPRN